MWQKHGISPFSRKLAKFSLKREYSDKICQYNFFFFNLAKFRTTKKKKKKKEKNAAAHSAKNLKETLNQTSFI
jgi:hypothetical protein